MVMFSGSKWLSVLRGARLRLERRILTDDRFVDLLWWTLAFAVIFLAPSMFGFVTKFIEFVRTFGQGSSEQHVCNHCHGQLFAGQFELLLLLVWQHDNGMFEDIEQPKVTMLENERALDRQLG